MKRNLIILLFIILSAVAALIYFSKDEIKFSGTSSVYKAVPISSPVFFEFKSLRNIPNDNLAIDELMNIEESSRFFKCIEKLDTLISNNNDLPGSLLNEEFLVAVDFVGDNTIFPLIIKNVDNSQKLKSIEYLLEILYPQTKFTFQKQDYSGYKITSVISGNENLLNFCFVDGLFLASPKAILVEKCIRQLNTQGILNNVYFEKVNKTVNAQSGIAIYINHSFFYDLLANWLNYETLTESDEFGNTKKSSYKSKVRTFEGFAAWSELDLKIDKDEIILNGISTADDSLNHFLSVFEGQEPVRFEADQILPRNTSFFLSYCFSDKTLFFERLEDYFVHSRMYYEREELIKKIELILRIDLKNTFNEMVNNEVIMASTFVPSEPQQKTTFFIIHTKGKSEAEKQLNLILNNYAKRKGIEAGDMKSVYSLDKDTKYKLYRFPYPSLPGIWLGSPFGAVKANYATFYENYLIFCSSKNELQDYLHDMVLEASLSKDVNYLKFKQNFANRTNINTYVDINKIYPLNEIVFNDAVSGFLADNNDLLQKFKAINWQIVSDRGVFFNTIFTEYGQKVQVAGNTIWQSNIGNNIRNKPQLVINHNNPGNREIVVQDDKNIVHLINKEGRILWSNKIDEPVLSEIHQVDYYKNGKLQYLFNSRTKLFLIDRNGNNVEHFPITFRSNATNGVNVFDYDNNRNYRYFVACEDKKVYAYDRDGKIVTGWKFDKTDHTVSAPIQHFRVNNKDYIVFKDRSRIYIQNRRGETRVTTGATFENSNNALVLNLNRVPKIVATDKTGKVYYLFFNGEFGEHKTERFGEEHYFTVNDLNGDDIPDYIFVDGKNMQVISENGKKLFEEKFDAPIKHKPNLYTFGRNIKKVGVVDETNNRIYLYNPDGKLHEGFPLRGNSEFSIGKLSKDSDYLNLITGSTGGDLFNYKLD